MSPAVDAIRTASHIVLVAAALVGLLAARQRETVVAGTETFTPAGWRQLGLAARLFWVGLTLGFVEEALRWASSDPSGLRGGAASLEGWLHLAALAAGATAGVCLWRANHFRRDIGARRTVPGLVFDAGATLAPAGHVYRRATAASFCLSLALTAALIGVRLTGH